MSPLKPDAAQPKPAAPPKLPPPSLPNVYVQKGGLGGGGVKIK